MAEPSVRRPIGAKASQDVDAPGGAGRACNQDVAE